jgi:hypothetical protein
MTCAHFKCICISTHIPVVSGRWWRQKALLKRRPTSTTLHSAVSAISNIFLPFNAIQTQPTKALLNKLRNNNTGISCWFRLMSPQKLRSWSETNTCGTHHGLQTTHLKQSPSFCVKCLYDIIPSSFSIGKDSCSKYWSWKEPFAGGALKSRKYSNKNERSAYGFVHRTKVNGIRQPGERETPEAVRKTQREVSGMVGERRLFGKRVAVMHSD